ncbi:polysaccharide lyase family 8 super-sandwich domain-containing protein [Membranihabitans marinus]|uniref:polysaccharide lyase family 8 super-sandwich domain-containing protein n=1 Tax=Membranihabitans marinus TaxID=1227546 RepID=UPI001F004777|nr:polysaccharide lyase family 8 super-sandwich domain-containing protein [Membranihabitans marinus]
MFKILLFLFTCLTFTSASDTKSDIEIVRERIIDEAMKSSVDDNEVKNILEDQTLSGNWDYINYIDTTNTGFEHRVHLSNIIKMALAYKTKSSQWYGNQKVYSGICKALKYWNDRDFICQNWWWNQIGTPTSLMRALLVMDADLPKSLTEKSIEIIGRAHMDASGARPSGDRIKIGGILAKKLLYLYDEKEFLRVINIIEGEIKFSTGRRGLQHDFSFHHRQDRVNNTLSYGAGYASAFAEWAAYVSGTSFAFGEEPIQILTDYYLDGICKMMPYGLYPDLGAKNRSISRLGSLKKVSNQTALYLLKVSDYRSTELQEIINASSGLQNKVAEYNKFFWQTEYMSHQRSNFFASVRMYSSRNYNMEYPYNSEGLKNHFLGDGSSFLSRTGQDYVDLFPVWDWHKIPGTTVVQKPNFRPENQIQEIGVKDFVGGVSNGQYGAAVMDYWKSQDSLKAKKSWFFFDNEYVCLGSDIGSKSRFPVATTINQNAWKTDVVINENGSQKILEEGRFQSKNPQYVWQDSNAYFFPSSQSLVVHNRIASGSWYDISKQANSPKTEIKKPLTTLWLDHGHRRSKSKYAYIVRPGISLEDADKLGDYEVLSVLENSNMVQAVYHKDLEIFMAVFYSGAEMDIGNGVKLEMDGPGLVMIKFDNNEVTEITLSDPSRKNRKMHLSISQPLTCNNANVDSTFDDESGLSTLSVTMPKAEFSGQSVIVSMN